MFICYSAVIAFAFALEFVFVYETNTQRKSNVRLIHVNRSQHELPFIFLKE